LFKTIGFKFGTFVEVDSSTKNLIRGDLARIKITTENMQMIDSSLAITVMGKKFVTRILEEVGEGMEGLMGRRCVGECLRWRDEPSCRGSNDGGSEMAVVEGSFDGGSDEGWSEVGRNLSGAECQGVGKEHVGCRRMDPVQDREKTEIDPNLLGNISNFNSNKVNQGGVDRLGLHEKVRNDGDNTLKVQGKWDIVPVNPCTSRDYGDEARGLVGSGGEMDGERNLEVRRMDGVRCNNGLKLTRPMDSVLKEGDPFPLGLGIQLGDPLDSIETQSVAMLSKEVGTTLVMDGDTSSTTERWRKNKTNKKQPMYHQHGSKFLNFQNYIQRSSHEHLRVRPPEVSEVVHHADQVGDATEALCRKKPMIFHTRLFRSARSSWLTDPAGMAAHTPMYLQAASISATGIDESERV
jgi:hypothetical protein